MSGDWICPKHGRTHAITFSYANEDVAFGRSFCYICFVEWVGRNVIGDWHPDTIVTDGLVPFTDLNRE